MKKYLYKINYYTDNIEIYKVVPRLKDISEFREKTINDDIIYDAIVNTSVNKADISSKYRITPDKYDRDLKENEVNNEYHRLVKSTNKDKCMIDNYIMDGIDADSYLYHVVGYKNYGLIIPSLEYNFYTKNSYIIKNILKIPDELYVLERIIKGEYSRIDDYYLEVLSPFFNIMQIGAISYRDIKNVSDVGVLSESLDSIIGRINTTEKVLQKLKK